MASRLTVRDPQGRARLLERATRNTPLQPIQINSPFQGYVPDLDPIHVGGSSANPIRNLVAKFNLAALGETLRPPDGYAEVDSTRLPLGDATPPAATGRHINMLAFFPRTNASGFRTGEYRFTQMVACDGDGSTPGTSFLYRRLPSTGVWQNIAHSGHGSSVALKGAYPTSDNETILMDTAVFPAGVAASHRSGLTAGPVGEPAFLFTNSIDPVMIYPVDAVSTQDGDYEILTTDFGFGASAFKCQSLTAWGGRMNYFNTEESGDRFRQRLRRTAIGTADPDPALTGSGALEFREFSEDGLRIEPLGNILACYLGDGVAFVERSGNPEAPYQYRVLTTKRGLLSTHSLTSVGGNEHFGLFTDGWFFLDSSGRWREAGVASINNIPVNKWKDTFFTRLDVDLRERIFVYYDQVNRLIFITFPADGADENTETWIYDPRGDRVWIQDMPITVFNQANVQIQVGTTIGSLPGTIGGLTGTIGSYGPKFGLKSTLHGTNNGLVMQHDPDITSRATLSRTTAEPTYLYRTILSSLGAPRDLKTAGRLQVECIPQSASATMTGQFFSNASAGTEQYNFDLSQIATGELGSVESFFRFTETHLGFQVSGQGPLEIRSMAVDILGYGVEKRT